MLGHFQLGGAPLGGIHRIFRLITLEAGTFTFTGQAAALATPTTLTAETGYYTFSGQDATLTHGHPLTAATGTFTLTGQAATLTSGRKLALAHGTFTLTGKAAAFTHTYTLVAEYGSYTLTGQDVSFEVLRGPGGIKMVPRSNQPIAAAGLATRPIRARHGYLRATH